MHHSERLPNRRSVLLSSAAAVLGIGGAASVFNSANGESRTPAFAELKSKPPAPVSPSGVIRTFTGHSDLVEAVAFSPDGRTALSGSRDEKRKLWDVATGEEIHTFRGHLN